jgi:hypothetical protein
MGKVLHFGYLPIDKKKIVFKSLEKTSSKKISLKFSLKHLSNNNLLEDITDFASETQLCCHRHHVTNEYIKPREISAWKKKQSTLHKHPTILSFIKCNFVAIILIFYI